MHVMNSNINYQVLQLCYAIMHNINWQQLRFILAVADAGSAAAAARNLGVNHSTVVRHIQKFEEAQNIRIFDHLATGYRLTEKGQCFLDTAKKIHSAIAELERNIASTEESLRGTITITTTDSLYALLVPVLTEYQQQNPLIQFDLLVTNNRLNIGDMEADIALRPSLTISPSLASRHLGSLPVGIFAPITLQQNGQFPSYDEAPWLGMKAPLDQSSAGEWLKQHIPESNIKIRCNSFVTMQQFAEQGAGYAILLNYLAEPSSKLVKLANVELPTKLWLLSHADMLRSKRIVHCLDFLEEKLKTPLAF